MKRLVGSPPGIQLLIEFISEIQRIVGVVAKASLRK
jgi:hypothetical protein